MDDVKVDKRHRRAGKRPAVGTHLLLHKEHYFYMNSRVPALRIKRTTTGWEAVDPDLKSGLIVFVTWRISKHPAEIVITRANQSVAIAAEAVV